MFIPEFDRDYLTERDYAFQEIIDGNNKGLVIKDWVLPDSKFTIDRSDLLILMPDGYPDVPPDMFYFFPALYLKSSNRFPRATETFVPFNNIQWQRWSRHLGAEAWRRGIDGLHTYLKRIDEALKVAS